MPTIADLKIELEDATTLKLISSAFTEASAARIQKIKTAFETNRQFYDEISHVYHLVRMSGANDKAALHHGKNPASPAKTLSVAVTSNQRFYGNLNVNIMHGFFNDIEHKQTDILVIGTTGQEYMRSVGYVQKYQKMNFLHDNPTTEETKNFIDIIEPYESVMVYYPKFVSLMTQTVGTIDLTQTVSSTAQPKEDEIQILFEPEYSKILQFFARQVKNLLFAHVMLETDLSRTAARLLTMSAAEERSVALIKQKKTALRKIQMSIANAKLLETFAGIQKWKK